MPDFVPPPCPVDDIPWNVASPAVMQVLGELSEKHLGRHQQLRGLDQFNSAIAETIAAQMAAQNRLISARAAEASLEVLLPSSNPTRHVKEKSIYDNNIIPRTAKLSALLTATPSPVKDHGINSALLGPTPMLSLPLKEPATLKLPKVNLNVNKNYGAISPLPECLSSTTPISSTDKHFTVTMSEDDYNDKYFQKADIYDSWNVDPVEMELFPELF
jgi:hypothetical protein